MRTHLDWALSFTGQLKRHFGNHLISVVLYGSTAIGEERPDSDIDLLIVLKEIKEGFYRRRMLLDPVFEAFQSKYQGQPVPFISPLLKTPEEARRISPLYFDMVDRSRILVDRDQFFKNILDDVQSRLNRLGAMRRKLGKIEYWDLKPDYKPGDVFEI